MKVISPINGKLIHELVEDHAQSVQSKYEQSRIAQKEWAKKTLGERVQVIRNFCELMEANKEKLAKDLTLEMGKPLREARNEINSSKNRFQFFIEKAATYLNAGVQNDDGKTQDVLELEPLGVIANISAWNYPYNIGANVIAPALIAGNAILYKPSELTPVTGQNIEKLLIEAGLPKGVFTAVIGTGEVGSMLCELPLDGYFFVGSYLTGKKIAEKVAHKLVPVGLELGGNDPLYVTDEVRSLNEVVESAVEGVFYNNGQSCCAVKRVYVHEKKYGEFVDAFAKRVSALKLGNPLLEQTEQGPISRFTHRAYLEELIEDAVSKGAKLLCGGKAALKGFDGSDLSAGAYFEPTVLSNVNHSMRIMKEEAFGPIIGLMSVPSDSKAVELMNDSEFGLTAAVYSSNLDRAKSILKNVDTGTAYINCCDRVTAYLPWNGRKHSGLKGTLSFLGFYEFIKPRGWQIRQG